jgi:hypothetical protein
MRGVVRQAAGQGWVRVNMGTAWGASAVARPN